MNTFRLIAVSRLRRSLCLYEQQNVSVDADDHGVNPRGQNSSLARRRPSELALRKGEVSIAHDSRREISKVLQAIWPPHLRFTTFPRRR